MNDLASPWRPLTPAQVREMLEAFDAPWWFTGGHALELAIGTSWREHADIDIGIRRRDAPTLYSALDEQHLAIAADGVLHPWDGRPLDPNPDRHENNVWIGDGSTWRLDVTVGAGDNEHWVYRRDSTLRIDWDLALDSGNGDRWLTPALQLLFKSKQVRPKDHIDAEVVIPLLDEWSLALLAVRLPRGHVWTELVDGRRSGCTAGDVHDVLGVLYAADVDVWVDGGWGVDALLRETTRRHDDLDLALPTRQWQRANEALRHSGWSLVRDDGPYNQVLLDRQGRLVDLHAFDDTTTVVGDDGIERHGPNGLAYEAGGFGGIGTIAGIEVRCMTVEFQVSSHTGYEVDDDDWHDIARLTERFDLAVPPDYEQFRRTS